jgi:ATP-dependent helicase/nuclease subunit B
MHEATFRAIKDGVTLITASRRLARALTQDFHSRQRAEGRSVWKTPDILPLDAFLERAWRGWVWSGASSDCPVLLNLLQEQTVWEEIIRASPAGDSLLQIPETASRAMEAWQLVHAYRLPVDGRFEATDDWAAFAEWSRDYRGRSEANNWIERARLSDFLAPRIASGEITRATTSYAGFDELTPQQAGFFETLGATAETAMPIHDATPECRSMPEAADEIRCAAMWARRLVERDPETQIAIVVPDLSRVRRKVERIFRDTLDPAGELGDRERCFHLSLGPALEEYPMVSAALWMLEFALGPVASPQASRLLRSPFLGGGEAEWSKRALLDAKLRRAGAWDVTVRSLLEAAGSCPLLQGVLRGVQKRVIKLPEKQAASIWSRDISALLEAFGWPGERPLNSREHQVMQAWHGALGNLAALDLTTPPMTRDQAWSRLREITAAPFQVENEDAPVEIMGMLEASGLGFAHLWIMGLRDDALPAAPNPNPFLPVALQRERKLPHSSAERELEFATRLINRLLGSAPDVVLSYPEKEGESVLAPSPLVAGGPWLPFGGDATREEEGWIAQVRAASRFEEIVDAQAPPVAADTLQSGGYAMFKDMAACPFRAFAKRRLAARPLEDPEFGLSYRDRGQGVHEALESIWRELGSRARLLALNPDELQALVRRGIDAALLQLGPGVGRNLERLRLEKRLTAWLEVEKKRDEFTVAGTEVERLVAIGGLQFQTRADRVDELSGGRQIILDYKTGKVVATGWDGDRPDDPQLPLYCATSERPVAGVALVMIRADELVFRGLTGNGATLPDFKRMRLERSLTLDDQIAEWRRVLERLASEFRAGRADVDPKPDACEHCGLRPLCRIREYENGRG